jgi:hypothetical protein
MRGSGAKSIYPGGLRLHGVGCQPHCPHRVPQAIFRTVRPRLPRACHVWFFDQESKEALQWYPAPPYSSLFF